MNHLFLVLGAAMSVALAGCVTAQPHNSQNALDWQGVYSGVLPCADCSGIATNLSLLSGGTYTLQTEYLGKKPNLFAESGTFVWNQEGNTITLKGIKLGDAPNQYRVGENQLTQLDLSGAVSTSVLNKVMAIPIENKKWQLVELNGRAVKGTAQTHYLTFDSNTKRLSAMAGCNTMGGVYDIKNETQLVVKQMLSTSMACENMQDEMAFAQVLSSVDHFSIAGNQLSLNKARMAPLARFEWVEF